MKPFMIGVHSDGVRNIYIYISPSPSSSSKGGVCKPRHPCRGRCPKQCRFFSFSFISAKENNSLAQISFSLFSGLQGFYLAIGLFSFVIDILYQIPCNLFIHIPIQLFSPASHVFIWFLRFLPQLLDEFQLHLLQDHSCLEVAWKKNKFSVFVVYFLSMLD